MLLRALADPDGARGAVLVDTVDGLELDGAGDGVLVDPSPSSAGQSLVLLVDGQEVPTLSLAASLRWDGLSTWTFATTAEDRPPWDDPAVTRGTPLGLRSVGVYLRRPAGLVAILERGLADSWHLDLLTGVETFQGVGREGRDQRDKIDYTLPAAHGRSLLSILGDVLPGAEIPADDLLAVARQGQIAEYRTSRYDVAVKLLAWSPFRLVATARGYRLINIAEPPASSREVRILSGTASASSDVLTRARATTLRQGVDLAAATPTEEDTPDEDTVGTLVVSAMRQQSGGGWGAFYPGLLLEDQLLERIQTRVTKLVDAAVRTRTNRYAYRRTEVPRYTIQEDGSLDPIFSLDLVLVEDGAEPGDSAPAYSGPPVFRLVETVEGYAYFAGVGAGTSGFRAGYFAAGAEGTPWSALAVDDNTGRKIGTGERHFGWRYLEGAIAHFVDGLPVPVDGRAAAGGGQGFIGAEVFGLVSEVYTVTEPAADDARKVGRIVEYSVAWHRSPGSRYLYQDGATSDDDAEVYGVVQTRSTVYHLLGPGVVRKIEGLETLDGDQPRKVTLIKSRPDIEVLATPGPAGQIAGAQESLKIQINAEGLEVDHPQRLEVVDAVGAETEADLVVVADAALSRGAAMPVSIVVDSAALPEPGQGITAPQLDSLGVVFVDSADHSQSGNAAPVVTITGVVLYA